MTESYYDIYGAEVALVNECLGLENLIHQAEAARAEIEPAYTSSLALIMLQLQYAEKDYFSYFDEINNCKSRLLPIGLTKLKISNFFRRHRHLPEVTEMDIAKRIYDKRVAKINKKQEKISKDYDAISKVIADYQHVLTQNTRLLEALLKES